MRISDWSSDVCSSDLNFLGCRGPAPSSRSGAPKLSAYIPSIRSVSSSVSASNSLSRARRAAPLILGEEFAQELDLGGRDRKSVVTGKSVAVRVDLGGTRIIKKKKKSI